MRDLRERLAARDERIRQLDGQILDQNQRRQDVAKRIDDLVTQVLQLESELGARRD